MVKFGGMKNELEFGVYETDELSPKMPPIYAAPQGGGPRGYSAQFDDDERDPWDYDDFRDDDEDDDDDYLKDEDDDLEDDDLDEDDFEYDDADDEPGGSRQEVEKIEVEKIEIDVTDEDEVEPVVEEGEQGFQEIRN